MRPDSVVIDGVRYVPVLQASPAAADLVRALVAMWWGWTDDIDDMVDKYAGHLRVLVTEDDVDDENETLEAFVAAVLGHMDRQQTPAGAGDLREVSGKTVPDDGPANG